MAIRKTDAGNFMVDVSVKGHPRFYETVDTEEEAKVLEKQKREELKYGAASIKKAKSIWTLGEAMKATQRECWDGAKAEVSSIGMLKKLLIFLANIVQLIKSILNSWTLTLNTWRGERRILTILMHL
jgi:hypothetical protein